MHVKLGQGSAIHMGLRLYRRGGIDIGNYTSIDHACTLDGRGHLIIGNNVAIAPEVIILTAGHNPDDGVGFGTDLKPVVIEDHVWIATRAMILPGVTIGYGAVVAAGAVVTRDVSPEWIVAGNPARPIRERRGPQTYVVDYKRWLQ